MTPPCRVADTGTRCTNIGKAYEPYIGPETEGYGWQDRMLAFVSFTNIYVELIPVVTSGNSWMRLCDSLGSSSKLKSASPYS